MLSFYVWIYLGNLRCILGAALYDRKRPYPPKTSQFCVIARPQRGRGNLEAEGMASRSEAREHEAKKIPITKDMDSLLHSASSLFIYGSVSFRSTIVRYGMANRFV